MTLGLFQIGDRFYLFDPHGCDGNGFSSVMGRACLIQSTDLEDIAARCRTNLCGETENPWVSLMYVKLVRSVFIRDMENASAAVVAVSLTFFSVVCRMFFSCTYYHHIFYH